MGFSYNTYYLHSDYPLNLITLFFHSPTPMLHHLLLLIIITLVCHWPMVFGSITLSPLTLLSRKWWKICTRLPLMFLILKTSCRICISMATRRTLSLSAGFLHRFTLVSRPHLPVVSRISVQKVGNLPSYIPSGVRRFAEDASRSDTDYHERKCNMKVETKVGSNSHLEMITSNATECWKELKTQRIRYQKITKGDVIDIRKFLFTDYRDYLIRYNDKTRVKAEQLAGKVILIYFVSLSPDPNERVCEKCDTSLLMENYNYLQQSHAFEIVFVAIGDGNERESEKRFEEIFSRMPWTAIPFSDVVCRKSLHTKFHVNNETTLFVVNSDGMVLQQNAKFIINDYGVRGFPFSDERIKVLDAEDDVAVRQPSLITILGSPQRDYVITNKGEKVPIHTLEGKVVALYFYEGLSSSTEKIKRVYEELAKTKDNFEVVLIYFISGPYPDNCRSEELFWKAFKTMPWLALPFQDPNHMKLKQIFEYPQEYDDDHFDQRPSLVIFGPHGEFIEPLGDCILGVYPVYPFTCEKVAKLETEKVQNLKMEMLWDPKTVFKRTDGSQMRFSQLAGKRVIHFFEAEEYLESEHCFLRKLKERYLEVKGTNDEFEVIHILEKEMDTMLPIQDLPWFVSFASELLPDGFDINGCYGNNYHGQSTLLAFDQDGKLVRRTIFAVFENIDFPFYAGSLEEETLSQLIELFGWDYWNFYPKGGRIYTLHKKLRQPSCELGTGFRLWSFNI